MLFNSYTFLAFLACVVILHGLPFSWRVKKFNLLIASYLFYAAWNPPFVALLWISTLTDWFVARWIAEASSRRTKRSLLLVSLGVNLGLLAYFKYAAFLLDNFVWLLNRIGFEYQPAAPDIILPLGISFYTFQTLSYTITIYRGDARPAKSLLDYALFVTFFPQLVAGPIVRAGDFISQLATPKRANARQLGWGAALISFGLFEKIVLADTMLAPIADQVFQSPMNAGFADAWIGALAFGCQIFFDFAGYSLCAIGAALCLGFILPRNFNCPYAAVGFADFWRRWHITLSTWLRDYLYFSLLSLTRQQRNALFTSTSLAITMLLGGLWHGASWNFVIWGGIHGAYLTLERGLRAELGNIRFFRTRIFAAVAGLATFALVTITWVFFRAQTLDESLALAKVMFEGTPGSVSSTAQRWQVLLIVAATLLVQALLRDSDLEERFSRLPTWLCIVLLALPLFLLFFVPGDQRAFIYFQF